MSGQEPIFIIESVGAQDLCSRRSEADGLERTLRLYNFPCTFHIAKTKEEFFTLLRVFFMSDCGILHLSCHGNGSGIGLMDGSLVSWTELFSKLERVDRIYALHISSCNATETQKLSQLFSTSDNRPVHIVGSPDSIAWSDAFVAWAIIYNNMRSVVDGLAERLQRSLVAIKIATGANFSLTFWGHESGELVEWKANEVLEIAEAIGIEEFIQNGCSRMEELLTDDAQPTEAGLHVTEENSNGS